MTNKFAIYDPPMCCSSGVCGPNPDHTLIALQDTLAEVRKLGAEVERYMITQNAEEFRKNPEVIKLIEEQELKALPITTFNGKVIKIGSYPTLAELKQLMKGE